MDANLAWQEMQERWGKPISASDFTFGWDCYAYHLKLKLSYRKKQLEEIEKKHDLDEFERGEKRIIDLVFANENPSNDG